jgi:hypothetical protein
MGALLSLRLRDATSSLNPAQAAKQYATCCFDFRLHFVAFLMLKYANHISGSTKRISLIDVTVQRVLERSEQAQSGLCP